MLLYFDATLMKCSGAVDSCLDGLDLLQLTYSRKSQLRCLLSQRHTEAVLSRLAKTFVLWPCKRISSEATMGASRASN